MIQVWLYDENKIFIESTFVEELDENMTTIPLLIGYIKPMFNGEEWVEGATQEEIDEYWAEQEANKPKPQPTEIEILQEQLDEYRLEQSKLHQMIIALERKMGGNE